VGVHERAIVDTLAAHTAPQPWWLGFLDTGAHDIVFPEAPLVSLYFNWSYVLVEGGPSEAMRWRLGHMRSGDGHLPDLYFPFDRSWFVTALWDDSFACIGGSTDLIGTLAKQPLVGLRRVGPDDEDMTPPGAPRDWWVDGRARWSSGEGSVWNGPLRGRRAWWSGGTRKPAHLS